MMSFRDIFTADPPDCGCGFMSEERIRILLGLETVKNSVPAVRTQQITPDMTFTCNGTITKWIFTAGPIINAPRSAEFQIWRNTGSDVYEKINGTLINMTEIEVSAHIYEYDAFPPIPVQAGDILGVFLPRSHNIVLLSENTRSSTNYYHFIHWSERVYNTFNLRDTSLRSRHYHLMVSVEISTLRIGICTQLCKDY